MQLIGLEESGYCGRVVQVLSFGTSITSGKRVNGVQFAERYPGVLLRLQPHQVESYIQLGLAGLRLHERFSLKSASDFFVRLNRLVLHASSINR